MHIATPHTHAWAAGMLVCRYLMRRCDNSPAPWDVGAVGDGPWLQDLPAQATEEIKRGQDIHYPQGAPYWDYDVKERQWVWTRSPPVDKGPAQRKPSAQQKETSVCCSLLCTCLFFSPWHTPLLAVNCYESTLAR